MSTKNAVPTATPWKTAGEFVQLRSWYFPALSDSEAELSLKLRAIARTKAYMIRGSIPHAVESTGLLVSAQTEDVPTANPLSVRLAMSTALIRFVNGIIDPYQKGQYVMPMQVIARDIGLPVFLVDLRHTCTHETLPSLKELRGGVSGAVEWLYANYWSVQEDHVQQALQKSNQADSDEIKEVFRQWRRLYRDNRDLTPLKDLNDPGNKIEARFAFLAKQIVKYYTDDPVALFATMVHQKVLSNKGQINRALLMPLLKSLPHELISDLFVYLFDEAVRVDAHMQKSEELSLSSNPEAEWLETFIEEDLLSQPQKTLLVCSRNLGKTALNVLDVYLMHKSDDKMEKIRQTMRDVVLSGDGRVDTAIETEDMVRIADEYKLRVKKEERKTDGFVGLEEEEAGPFKRVKVE